MYNNGFDASQPGPFDPYQHDTAFQSRKDSNTPAVTVTDLAERSRRGSKPMPTYRGNGFYKFFPALWNSFEAGNWGYNMPYVNLVNRFARLNYDYNPLGPNLLVQLAASRAAADKYLLGDSFTDRFRYYLKNIGRSEYENRYAKDEQQRLEREYEQSLPKKDAFGSSAVPLIAGYGGNFLAAATDVPSLAFMLLGRGGSGLALGGGKAARNALTNYIARSARLSKGWKWVKPIIREVAEEGAEAVFNPTIPDQLTWAIPSKYAKDQFKPESGYPLINILARFYPGIRKIFPNSYPGYLFDTHVKNYRKIEADRNYALAPNNRPGTTMQGSVNKAIKQQ